MLNFSSTIRHFASKGTGCPKPKVKCEKITKKPPYKKKPPVGCLSGPSGVHPVHQGGYKLWRNMFFFLCVPLIGMCAYHLYTTWEEPERAEFIKLEYMRIRHKKFFWCGGTDRSFFHNPRLNALPDGYEEEDEDDE